MSVIHFRNTGGARALPINLLGQATRWLSRAEQEDLIERLIAHIDSMDGESDLELNGDELDGSLGEDDFHMHNDAMRYPGCPVSDPDMGVEDGDFDPEEDRCEAGDDGCGAILIHGAVRWGSELDQAGRLPKYGADQSRGPINPY